jgi:hypothetical protein
MLVSEAEKNAEDKMRKINRPTSKVRGMSLKKNKPLEINVASYLSRECLPFK